MPTHELLSKRLKGRHWEESQLHHPSDGPSRFRFKNLGNLHKLPIWIQNCVICAWQPLRHQTKAETSKAVYSMKTKLVTVH